MNRFISLYFYTIVFVQFYVNVKLDTYIDTSKLEISDYSKKLLLEHQLENYRLQLELLEVRNAPRQCEMKSEISLDVRTANEKRKVVLDDQKPNSIKTPTVVSKITQTEIKKLPKSCGEAAEKVSGVYQLNSYAAGRFPLKVYCDFDTQDGGWTVIQRRINGTINFNRSWQDYKNGFGDINGEFWLGLDHIHTMTKSMPHELLIVLEDFDNQTRWAKYDLFVIGNETEKFVINSLGSYSGNANNSFSGHLLDKFSTYDMDHDSWDRGNCASSYRSGWWFNRCLTTNLNGPAINGEFDKSNCCRGIHWFGFRGKYYSLKSTKMMLRSKTFIGPESFNWDFTVIKVV